MAHAAAPRSLRVHAPAAAAGTGDSVGSAAPRPRIRRAQLGGGRGGGGANGGGLYDASNGGGSASHRRASSLEPSPGGPDGASVFRRASRFDLFTDALPAHAAAASTPVSTGVQRASKLSLFVGDFPPDLSASTPVTRPNWIFLHRGEPAWRSLALIPDVYLTPASSHPRHDDDYDGDHENDDDVEEEDEDSVAALSQIGKKSWRRSMKTVSEACGAMNLVAGSLGMAALEGNSDELNFGSSGETSKSELQKGMALKDKRQRSIYHVGKKLGSGGFGTVYEGIVILGSSVLDRRQGSDGTKHALKVLNDASQNAEACSEALIQMRVQGTQPHPHICSVRRVLLVRRAAESREAATSATTAPSGRATPASAPAVPDDEEDLRTGNELIFSMDIGQCPLQDLIFKGTCQGPFFQVGEGRVQIAALRYGAQLLS